MDLDLVLEIKAERRYQEVKHEGQSVTGKPIERGLTILTEEVGEVAKALLDCEPRAKVRKECIQVAAVAVAMIEAIDAGKELSCEPKIVPAPKPPVDAPAMTQGALGRELNAR